MGTGLIFAAVVVIWLAYLVPLALRRYDEASRAGSVDKFSNAMRVLTHRRADPGDASDSAGAPSADEQTPAAPKTSCRAPLTRETARIAAARRRRTLLTLLGSVVVVAALAAFAVLPIWAGAVPAGLVLAWLVACRIQVRGERGLGRRSGEVSPDDEPTVVIPRMNGEHGSRRPNVMESAPLEDDHLLEVEVEAVPVTSPTGATLWDPVPVTLPTYVTKPRAARTIRTIEFGEPDVWTSGHVAGEDTDVPRREAAETEHRRAVGD